QGPIGGRRREWTEVRKRRQIKPVTLVMNRVLLIEQAADAAYAPSVRRSEPQLVTQVGIALSIAPGCAWCEALRRCGSLAWIDTLVVIDVLPAAGVAGVVLNLVDVSYEVASCV